MISRNFFVQFSVDRSILSERRESQFVAWMRSHAFVISAFSLNTSLEQLKSFQKLGVNRNYVKLLENQLDVIKQRLEGTVREETKYLSKTKDELEKKLKLVQEAQKLST